MNPGMNRADLRFNLPNMLKWTTVDDMVTTIYWFLYPALIVVSISIIYSGIRYIMAGGDPTAAAAAKKNLIWGITGMVVIILALAIVTWAPRFFTGTLV